MTEIAFLAALLGLTAAAIALVLVALLASAAEDQITRVHTPPAHESRRSSLAAKAERNAHENETDKRQASQSVDQQNPQGRQRSHHR
jgi:hypothetical protein